MTQNLYYSVLIYPVKVPLAGVYAGKVPVQKGKTAHIALLLPPIACSLLLGLNGLQIHGARVPHARRVIFDKDFQTWKNLSCSARV